MPRRPPHPFERFLDTIRDSLLDATEDLVDDAIDAIERNYQRLNPSPPPNAPHHAPRPGAPGRSRASSTRPRSRRGHKTTPGAPHDHLDYGSEMLYDVLEVGIRASQETIAAAYKSLARKFHPDVPGTGDVDRMKRINRAHEVLSDPRKRRQYDRSIGI